MNLWLNLDMAFEKPLTGTKSADSKNLEI